MTKPKKVTDKDLIEALMEDEIFLSSIEESLGKLKALKADYKAGKLIYEFMNGEFKETSLSMLAKKLREIGYYHTLYH